MKDEEQARQSGPIRAIDYLEMPGTSLGGVEATNVPGPGPAAAEADQPLADVPPAPAAEVGPRVRLGKSSYISATASVTGDVVLGQEVFVAPGASVRGDTGSRIAIGNFSNVQDGAVVHGAEGASLSIGGSNYAVCIGERVSLGHLCLVHGPALIGDDSSIGYGALVVSSRVGKGCVIMHLAYVANVDIPDGRLVPTGAVVDSAERARTLGVVPPTLVESSGRTVQANRRRARDLSNVGRRQAR